MRLPWDSQGPLSPESRGKGRKKNKRVLLPEEGKSRGAKGRRRVERGKGELSEHEVRANWVAWDRPEHEGTERRDLGVDNKVL